MIQVLHVILCNPCHPESPTTEMMDDVKSPTVAKTATASDGR